MPSGFHSRDFEMASTKGPDSSENATGAPLSSAQQAVLAVDASEASDLPHLTSRGNFPGDDLVSNLGPCPWESSPFSPSNCLTGPDQQSRSAQVLIAEETSPLRGMGHMWSHPSPSGQTWNLYIASPLRSFLRSPCSHEPFAFPSPSQDNFPPQPPLIPLPNTSTRYPSSSPYSKDSLPPTAPNPPPCAPPPPPPPARVQATQSEGQRTYKRRLPLADIVSASDQLSSRKKYQGTARPGDRGVHDGQENDPASFNMRADANPLWPMPRQRVDRRGRGGGSLDPRQWPEQRRQQQQRRLFGGVDDDPTLFLPRSASPTERSSTRAFRHVSRTESNPSSAAAHVHLALPETPVTREGSSTTKCKCRKSQCLQLYCDCFAAGAICGPHCRCESCKNVATNTDEIELAVRTTLERNPSAFRPKIQVMSRMTTVDGEQLAVESHYRGCNCRKSGCQKKYCECYRENVPCGDKCKCHGCQNGGRPQDSSPIEMTPAGWIGSRGDAGPFSQSLHSGRSQTVMKRSPLARRLDFSSVDDAPPRQSTTTGLAGDKRNMLQ